MYTKNNIYPTYISNLNEKEYSSDIPDITKKRTLHILNTAINCCEDWETALDIGGGNGHYSLSLTEKFKNIFLIEPTKHIEHVKITEEYKNYSVINKLVEEVELGHKADFIMLCDLYEHIVDIKSFVHKISDLQNTGGVVYILTPNPLFCGPAVQSEIHNSKIGIYGHERHYFPHEIIKLMSTKGYFLVHQSYEDLTYRDNVRRILRALSRRHATLCKKAWYSALFKRLVKALFAPILYILEHSVYRSEYNNRNNAEQAKSVAYIFKKI